MAVAALAAAGAVIGATLLQTRGETTSLPTQPGRPPLELSFGLDSSARTQALVRAQALYNHGHLAQAATIFARYRTVEARVGSAFVAWSGDGLATIERLAAANPASGVVQLHLGLADFWAGRNAEAVAAWQKTAKIAADSPYGVRAEDLLHPSTKTGLPFLVLDFGPSRRIAKLPAAKELAALAKEAARPDAHAKLLYGWALWNLERPLSAERQFAAAARLAPHDPLARTAAAVGAYTKADPAQAFGRLGPLTGAFPRSSVVRLELGLLLLWNGEQKKAVTQLGLAAEDEPGSPYSKDAKALLARLPGTRPK